MIGEFEMRAGQIDLRHVTRRAVLHPDFAARRGGLFARLRRLRGGARSAPLLVTGQAFRVVIGLVMRRRFMRVVTRRAARSEERRVGKEGSRWLTGAVKT